MSTARLTERFVRVSQTTLNYKQTRNTKRRIISVPLPNMTKHMIDGAKILLLGSAQTPQKVRNLCAEPDFLSEPIREDDIHGLQADVVVSFGYRHVIPPTVLQACPCPLVNVHVSLLPWNRGADPNFWSWVENTPKGVSLHRITEGLDKGELFAQEPIVIPSRHTLRSSYDLLIEAATNLLIDTLPAITNQTALTTDQIGVGSYHRAIDKEAHLAALSDGFDTRCDHLMKYGERYGLWREV